MHHKHSYYIIRNSNLPGFTDIEINLIANVARYHRKSHPKESHTEFANLPSDIKSAVRKLASILRIVDALDRTHSSVVTSIKCNIGAKKVELELRKKEQKIDIELWSLKRRKALFEETFNRKLTVNGFTG